MGEDGNEGGRGGWDRDDPRNDKVYLGILMALMGTVFAAAAVAIAGDLVWQSEAMRRGGFYIALVAGVIYFIFRFWGRAKAAQAKRERMRRELAEGDDDRGAP